MANFRVDRTKFDTTCVLCAMLLRGVDRNHTYGNTVPPVSIRTVDSRILVEQEGQLKQSLTIGRLPDEDISAAYKDVQISSPRLPGIESSAHGILLQQWLQDCDANHPTCCREEDLRLPPRLPTRLLALHTAISGDIRLLDSADIPTGPSGLCKYAALSYRWGNPGVHQYYQTTTANLSLHKRRINIEDLPLLVQDAVKVARDIKTPYLWIDSLCIVQDDNDDWDEEAARMLDVFSVAYCVIAASRSTGVSDGFLGEPEPRKSIPLPNSSLFIAEDIDDFQRDVIEGHLNKRAWVLQERALARRTIYFRERQMYWECGEGIRCETMTKMRNKQAAFLGDPNFPRLAEMETKGGKILLSQKLYEQYSRLAFTYEQDRPIAIAGIEERLCRAFDSRGGYGVFEKYLGRSILWQRADEEPTLGKIDFSKERGQIPSWSWMAYMGAVNLLELPFGKIEWTSDYQSPWSSFRRPP